MLALQAGEMTGEDRMEYKSTGSTDKPDLRRVQEGYQGRASVCLEAEGGESSSQGRGYPSGESAPRLSLKDNGCELYPDCLTCPFEHCIEDVPRGRLTVRKMMRNTEIRKLASLGMTAKELAIQFGVHVRTVQRTLAGGH